MRVRVKICGLTRIEDVRLASSLGADAVGFVFAPGPRRLSVDHARGLVAAVPAWVSRVGVFGPDEREEAIAIAETCRLDTLQLHGVPDPAFCDRARRRFAVVQAIAVDDDAQRRIDAIAPHIDAVLLDTHQPGKLGGTGLSWNWAILDQLRCPAPLIVAGGLNAERARELLARHAPWGLDVSSGIEASPGIKDAERMKAFFAAVP